MDPRSERRGDDPRIGAPVSSPQAGRQNQAGRQETGRQAVLRQAAQTRARTVASARVYTHTAHTHTFPSFRKMASAVTGPW